MLRNIKLKVEQFQRGELVVDESESTEGSSKKKKGKKGKKKKGGGTAALAVPGDDGNTCPVPMHPRVWLCICVCVRVLVGVCVAACARVGRLCWAEFRFHGARVQNA